VNDALTRALGLGPRKAPTPETLHEVWKRWHFLGNESAHIKPQLLVTTTTYMWQQSMVEAAARLRKEFGGFLDPKTYETSIDLARIWTELQDFLSTTKALHSELIESNLRWEHLDNQTPGRLGIFRAAQHVSLFGKMNLDSSSPAIDEIKALQNLCIGYSEARRQAMSLLMEIAFPNSLRNRRVKIKKGVEYSETTEDHPRGLGIPSTVRWEVEIAQLAALQRVSRTALEQFMTTRFLDLPCAEQIDFVKAMHATPRRARNKCGTVAPWLADNAPLLRLLRAQWNDVETLVKECFPAGHRPAQLRTFASKHCIRLGFKSGSNYINRQGVTIPASPHRRQRPRLDATTGRQGALSSHHRMRGKKGRQTKDRQQNGSHQVHQLKA